MKIKDVFAEIGKGAVIGTACIVPGVSGGTLAVILKIYNKIILAIGNLLKKSRFVESVKILLPILLGAAVALATLWIPLNLAFEHIVIVIVSLFAGFIIGGIPSIKDNIKENKTKPWHVIIGVVSLLIAIGLGVMSVFLKMDIQTLFDKHEIWFYFILIPVGAIVAVALIVPGISGSMILLVLGFYQPILDSIHNLKNPDLILPTLGMWACLGIGFIIGLFTIAKFMGYIFKRAPSATNWAILGFVIGSVFSLFFNYEIYNQGYLIFNISTDWWQIIVSAIVFAIGFVCSYSLIIYSRKHKKKNEQLKEENT